MKKITLALAACMAALALQAGPTATLLKTRAKSSAAVETGKWHANFTKARSYAIDRGVPFVAVWSNGDACGHCSCFASASNSKYFRNWQKTSGMVFWFGWSGDKAYPAGSSACEWARKGKTVKFPFVRIYWPKGGVDVATHGDVLDGRRTGTTGGKKIVAYIKGKLPGFKYNQPYSIAFEPNGGEGEMDSVAAKYGVSLALPANAFVREDCLFAGWAKSATGSVAYKNKATVKNLTTVKNGTVKLYAKWTRQTYRGFTVGKKKTLTITANKGWKTSSKFDGMKWNAATGKLSGVPKKAGTFKMVFKKGAGTRTRYFVVEPAS